jgi:hypothetical protein
MTRKEIIAITIMIVFGFSVIISIPVILISVGFSPYNTVEYHPDPWEEKFNSSGIVDLNLKVDVADVLIYYTYGPVDYHAKVNLNIDMISQNFPGKEYSDYFNIGLETTNTSLTFTMTLLSENEFDDVIWREQDINVIVTLNAAILFNINTTINKQGDLSLQVLGGININDVDLYTKSGNILVDFYYCTIGGNITGIVGVGTIDLSVINVQYTHKCVWNLTNYAEGIITFGKIFIDITQYTAIKANITGTVKTRQGDITLHYTDSTPTVGANFTFYGASTDGSLNGFEEGSHFAPDPWPSLTYHYSHDYPAIGNYDLSFYIYIEGNHEVNLKNNIAI